MKANKPTLCPCCDRPMRLASVAARSGSLPAVHTFDCNLCCVAMTKADDEPLATEERRELTRSPPSKPLPAPRLIR
jgi:hypothetical protein